MIKQNKNSIYSLKSFDVLMSYIQILTRADPYRDIYDTDDSNLYESYRIIADHFRTCIISLAQGIKFGAHKRGNTLPKVSPKGNILQKIFRRLLRKIYLYMLNGQVKCIMTHPIIINLINHVLEYFKQNIDKDHLNAVKIRNMMIANQTIYINKIRRCGNLMKKHNKNKISDTFGIDEEIINNWNRLKFI